MIVEVIMKEATHISYKFYITNIFKYFYKFY